MIMSTIGITDSHIPNDFESLFGPELLEDTSLVGKTKNEKLEILSKRKMVISKIVEKLQNVTNEIDQRIESILIFNASDDVAITKGSAFARSANLSRGNVSSPLPKI